MAAIIKRGNSYSVVYTLTVQDTRKQKWETYHTMEEAERRKITLELQKEAMKIKSRQRAGTVSELLELYVRRYGTIKWSLSTFQSNQGLIQNYILPLFGSIRLEELSPCMVAELYRNFLEQPRYSGQYQKSGGQTVTAATLRSVHKLLHSAFENAVLWELVERNPFHRAAMPALPRTAQPFLTPAQVQRLLECCSDPQLGLAIQLAFAGTLRKGELLALTWDDIDWERSELRVEKTIARVSREAVRQLHGRAVLFEFPPVWREEKTMLVLKAPKTASSRRTVYLPQTVLQALDAERRRQSSAAEDLPDLVFRHLNGRPIQEHWLNQRLRRLADQLGLPPVAFHSLRHSSISYKLILTSGNIKAVQGDAGHAQAEMVTEIYAHIWDENRRENAQRFEEQFYQNCRIRT